MDFNFNELLKFVIKNKKENKQTNMKFLLIFTALFKLEDTNSWTKKDDSIKTFEPTFLIASPNTKIEDTFNENAERDDTDFENEDDLENEDENEDENEESQSNFYTIVDNNVNLYASTILKEVKNIVKKAQSSSSSSSSDGAVENLPEWSKLSEVLTGLAASIKNSIAIQMENEKANNQLSLSKKEESSYKTLIEPFQEERLIQRFIKDFRDNYVDLLLELLPKNIRLSRLDGVIKVIKYEAKTLGNEIFTEASHLETIKSINVNFPLGATSITGKNTSLYYCSKGNLLLKLDLKNGMLKEKILGIPFPFVDTQLAKKHNNRNIERVIFGGTPKENMLKFLLKSFPSIKDTTIIPLYMENKKYYKAIDVRFDCYYSRGARIYFELTNPVGEARKERKNITLNTNEDEGGEENE